MKRFAACLLLSFHFAAAHLLAQQPTVKPAASANPAAAKVIEKASPNSGEKSAAKGGATDPLKAAFGGGLMAPTDGPVTTEIYADEAFFDSQKYIGTFTGHVIVNDPRFNIQADKLTVYIAHGEQKEKGQPPGQGQGLEKAVAEGNVGVVRDRPSENGGPPARSVGRAERAVYTAGDGNVELSGSPRVQSGLNTHVATSPDTVMLINQGGQLTTRGPSRTDLRQEPKAPAPPKP